MPPNMDDDYFLGADMSCDHEQVRCCSCGKTFDRKPQPPEEKRVEFFTTSQYVYEFQADDMRVRISFATLQEMQDYITTKGE